MVGKRRPGNSDHPPQAFWKDPQHEYGGTFFSIDHAGRSDLFEGLKIWQDEKYRKLQGNFPVISLSFADIKETSFPSARKSVCRNIKKLYNKYDFLLQRNYLNADEKNVPESIP